MGGEVRGGGGDLPGLAGRGGAQSGAGVGQRLLAPKGSWAPSSGLRTMTSYTSWASAPELGHLICTSPSSRGLGASGRKFHSSLKEPPFRPSLRPHPCSPSWGHFLVGLGLSPRGLAEFKSHGTTLGGTQPLVWALPKFHFFLSYVLSILGSGDLSFPG